MTGLVPLIPLRTVIKGMKRNIMAETLSYKADSKRYFDLQEHGICGTNKITEE